MNGLRIQIRATRRRSVRMKLRVSWKRVFAHSSAETLVLKVLRVTFVRMEYKCSQFVRCIVLY